MDVIVSFTPKRIKDGMPELEDEEGRDGESPNSTSEGPSGSYMDNNAADEHNGWWLDLSLSVCLSVSLSLLRSPFL